MASTRGITAFAGVRTCGTRRNDGVPLLNSALRHAHQTHVVVHPLQVFGKLLVGLGREIDFG